MDRAISYRSPLTWVFLLALAAGIALNLADNGILLFFGPAAQLAVAAWLVFAVVVITVMVLAQRNHRLPRAVITLSLLWGVAAMGYATYLNAALRRLWTPLAGDDLMREWGAALSAPPSEEFLKALGVLALLMMVPGIRTAFGGLFVGALVGWGFLFVESAFFTIGVLSSSGDLRIIPLSLGLRGVLEGMAGHPAFTALIGAAIGNLLAAPRESRRQPALLLVGVVIAVLVLHGLIDADPVPDAVRWVTGALTAAAVVWAWVASLRALERSPAGV